MKRRSLEKMIWSKVAARLGQSLAPLEKRLCKEKQARQKLEECVRLLEDKVGNKVAKGEPEDEVDKRVRQQGSQRGTGHSTPCHS